MSSSEDDDIIVVATMLLLNNKRRRRLDLNPIQSNGDSRGTIHPDPSRSRSKSSPYPEENAVRLGPSPRETFAVLPSSSSRHRPTVGRIPIRRVGPKPRPRSKGRMVAGNPITIIRPRSHHKRKFAVHPLHRESNAILAKLYPQLCDDEEKFFNFTGMPRSTFEELLPLVHESIRKVDTNFRKAIWPRERLLLTLRFLVAGETSRSMHQRFQLGVSTVQKIIYEVCEALWEQLKHLELPKLTEALLYGIAQKFWVKWNYPHCLGTIDNKRIRMKCPCNSGGQYNSFIILQGIADADGNFIAVDVGGDGKDADRDVLKQSSFGQALYANHLPVPRPDTQLDGDIHLNEPLPYVFVGDLGYPLLKCLMRPYPERGMDNSRRIYNLRHSYALKSVDSAFSTMTAKWAILKGCLQMNPGNATKTILACCVLHNFVRRRECVKEDLDEAPLKNFERNKRVYDGVQPKLTGRPCLEAIQCRDKLAQLFTSNLSIPGQDTAANVRNLLPVATDTDTSLTTVSLDDAVHSATTVAHFNSMSVPSL